MSTNTEINRDPATFPPDANDWDERDDGRVTRWFSGPVRSLDGSAGTSVRIWHAGEQEYGGQVLLRLIVLDADEGAELGSNQARELAAALVAAADELDQWTTPSDEEPGSA